MKSIIIRHYELFIILMFTIVLSSILILFDVNFITDNIIREYFGIGVYALYIGISASFVSLIRKAKLVKSFYKEHFIQFLGNVLKWSGTLFIIAGCVNEFTIINSGGILGNFYKEGLYDVFPYYSLVFVTVLGLYGKLFRFPYRDIFNFTSESIGELTISLFEAIKIDQLMKKLNIGMNLKRRKEVIMNFDVINDDPYLHAKEKVEVGSDSFEINKISNTPVIEEEDTTTKQVVEELVEDVVEVESEIFEDFGDKISSGQFDIENRLDGVEVESDDEVTNMLNTAFKNMNLPGITVFPITKESKGPFVTTYELKLPDNMEVSKLDDEKKLKDLTRRLKVKTVRVKYNQGGTDHVFLEVPNQESTTVEFTSNMKKIIPEMTKQNLPLFIGVDTTGKPRSYDLSTFPHMLVSGATGKGKTVGIHGMLSSLLTMKKDYEVKLVMVDPKLMEFVHYSNSPYLLDVETIDSDYMEIDDIAAPLIEKQRANIEYIPRESEAMAEGVEVEEFGPDDVEPYDGGYSEFQVTDGIVCDMEIVPEILSKLVFIMQVRLLRLKAVRAANLTEYNKKVEELDGVHKDRNGVEREVKKMPYVVVVIDELADLMEEYGTQMEGHIKRLAQKARAAGIHVILCTQRPSVDVVSGVIKANMPVRLSYALTTKVDATTTGVPDAHKLLGKGDCIIKTSDEYTRLHGPFIQNEQVQKIAKATMY